MPCSMLGARTSPEPARDPQEGPSLTCVTTAWVPAALRPGLHDPTLVVELAARLPDAPAELLEIVRLTLEALDCALVFASPPLLADHLRWRTTRLGTLDQTEQEPALDALVLDLLAGRVDQRTLAELRALWEAAKAVVADSPSGQAAVLAPGRAHDYLEAAVHGRRDEAVRIVREALFDERGVAEIVTEILEASQRELGRRWERGEITIAEEHQATAITQLSLSLLYPRLVTDRLWHEGRQSPPHVVAATAQAEGHEVGLRMVTDLLEHDGWRTTYLGADLPPDEVVGHAALQRADVLAVSATMPAQLRAVHRIGELLRGDPRCAGIRLLVGGRPFQVDPGLAGRVGADGSAATCQEAVEVCRAWAGRGMPAPRSPSPQN